MKKILLASFLIVFAAFAGVVFAGYASTDVVSFFESGNSTFVAGSMSAIRNSGNSVEYIRCSAYLNSITICEAKDAAGTTKWGSSGDPEIADQVRSINSVTKVVYEIGTQGTISMFTIMKGSQYME